MDKTGSNRNDNADVSNDKGLEDENTSKVVMRKPKNVYEPIKKNNVGNKDGSCGSGVCDDEKYMNKKQVKWSESTDLRERLKVYRRSQLDIPLDYQHFAIEEKRERVGVQVWRTHLQGKEDIENVEDSIVGVIEKEDLERNLQVIKEETTRFTLYPAYTAAISVYKEWLSNSNHTKQLTEDQITTMTSQMNLYKRLVDIYKDWTQQTSTDMSRESRFGEITSILQEASNLGHPPSCVSKVIKEVLTDEENVQKQVDAYNNQVQEMIAGLDITTKV